MGVLVSPIALYASPNSCMHKPIVRGLSSLYPTVSVKHGSCAMSYCGGGVEELSSIRFDSVDKLRLLWKRDHYYYRPVSVLNGAVTIELGNGRVFDGVVRHGLGSCLEYDVDLLGIGVDELRFEVDYGSHESYFEYLLWDAQSRHKIFYDGFVIKAFREAEVAHRGQMRLSGDPHLKHCVETSMYLAVIGANSTVIAAGLLHDTIDDSVVTHDYISRTFGDGVADLVKGVSKLSHLSKLARDNNTANKTVEADRLHTMFLAMADARAVLIKLADRLHNMMTLDALPNQKRKRFAKETLEIFVPLANRLGITTWKEQLETLCFKYVYPKEHEELAAKLLRTFDEALISSTISKLECALKVADISYQDLSGRHKSLFSIHRKMLKKNLNMDEIHDIHGIRLIVEKEEDCYNALEVIHNLWHAIPGRFKDYITRPKFNGYQSLHTVVMGDCLLHIEVQIRTMEMHVQAEFGFAAHWRYKEGDCKYSSFVLQMIEWARWVVYWQCETMSKDQSLTSCVDSKPPCKFPYLAQDCAYSYKPHCGSDGPVIVIVIENDKMSVQEFPANSSVMNLLERCHGRSRWTPYGFSAKEELRPRVNHVPVDNPTCKLKMGDVVELSPPLPDKSLTEYREEIQRMYDRGLTISNGLTLASGSVVHLRLESLTSNI